MYNEVKDLPPLEAGATVAFMSHEPRKPDIAKKENPSAPLLLWIGAIILIIIFIRAASEKKK